MTSTIADLAKQYDVAPCIIANLTNNGVIPKQYIHVIDHVKYVDDAALEYIDAAFTKGDDWLTYEEMAAIIGKDVKYVRQYLSDIDKAYKKKIYPGGRYVIHVSQADFYKHKLRKRIGIEIVNPPPPDKEWFRPVEFTTIFGRGKHAVDTWIRSGTLPMDYVKLIGGGNRRIHRDAIEYVAQHAHQLWENCAKKQEPIEWKRLIVIDGYELTPDQHLRRLIIRSRVMHDVPHELFNSVLAKCKHPLEYYINELQDDNT